MCIDTSDILDPTRNVQVVIDSESATVVIVEMVYEIAQYVRARWSV